MVAAVILAAVFAQPPVGSGGGADGAKAGGSVQLRGQLVPMNGEVAGVSFAGVLLKVTPDDPGRLIAWDKVRTVEGGAAGVASFLPYADALMRARARLERGDTWLADQAIEPLYQQAVGAAGGVDRFVGPSGLLLAECALRSGLERNASASATLAWLQWAAVDRQRPKAGAVGGGANAGPSSEKLPPQWVGGTANLPSVIDAATGLCPRLPPIFPRQSPSSVGTLRVLTQSAQLKRLCAEGSLSRGLALPYALAARIAAGEVQTGETASLPAPSGDAEQLVSDIVAAQTAPGEPMRNARARLQRRLEVLQRDTESKETAEEAEPPADKSWQRAWLHAAIGRSLLAEDQLALRRQGLVELLHVPALDGNTQPMLAATALLDVIDQLRRDGEGAGTEGAIAALTAELRTRFGVEPTPAAEPTVPTPDSTSLQPIAPAPTAPPPGAPSAPSATPPSKEVP